jgi:hypothetical protein
MIAFGTFFAMSVMLSMFGLYIGEDYDNWVDDHKKKSNPISEKDSYRKENSLPAPKDIALVLPEVKK